jgi:hypothetical protein
MSKSNFNKYAQFPNVPGIIIVRNKQNEHLWTMYTDNIRHRIAAVDADHIANGTSRTSHHWGMGRKTVADASGVLVFDYIEMPTTDRNTMKMVAEAMDKESLSKQLDQLVGV